ncbi:MAG: glycosyltransferase family 2 protein [Ignavibacteria bacterium]|nr:glycosyltransferase family 2 protein [Ignavibacteria bacterium]
MNQSWSVIIIAYNEEKTIASVIDQVQNFFKKNNISDSEIIVVDDGSDDNTHNIIKDIVNAGSDIKRIRHSENLGIGMALLSGYKNAEKENVMMIPADGQFDIDELSENKNFSVNTYLSFYRKELKDYTFFRKVVTGMNRTFNKYLLNLGIKDVNWVKAYKTSELKSLDLKLESSLLGSEICAKLNVKGTGATEIPSVYHKRSAGTAKGASFKNLIKAVTELLKLTFVIRQFRKDKIN